jgi:O-antigen biosynthesis protein
VERVLFAPRALPPLRSDVDAEPRLYDTWVREREAVRCGSTEVEPSKRSLHVVMVVDGCPPPETAASLRSLGGQLSGAFAITAVMLEPWQPEVTALLGRSDLGRPVELVAAEDGTDAADLLARALAAIGGRDVALIYPGDVWAPDTVSQLAAALGDAAVVYADEDCLDDTGRHACPRLKPNFSPDYLLYDDFVGRPLALGADVVAKLPPASSRTLTSREHDLVLRACEVAASVHHVPEVLCHRRIPPVSPTDSHYDGAHVEGALARRHDGAVVAPGPRPGTHRIVRRPETLRTACVVIPFRDQPRFLRACIDSVDRTCGDVVPTFLLVDNASEEPETATLLERLASRPGVRILHDERPFNWAALNNSAAAQSDSDVLVFLNNDIEALTPGWLDRLCAQVERPGVGVAGARLLYPGGRVQHCGVVIGLGGAAGHLLVGLDGDVPGYLDMAIATRECSAVTGACLATRTSLFEELGGFDESLGVDLNDIDYCLRVWGSGHRVVYEASAELVHYESPSRGTAGDVRDIVRFVERWKEAILAGDPFLNPNLTRVDSSCALRDPGEEDWWQRWYAGLSEA